MNAARCPPIAGRRLIGVALAMSGLSKLAAYWTTIDLIASSKLSLPSPLAYAGAVMVEVGRGVLMLPFISYAQPQASSRCSASRRP